MKQKIKKTASFLLCLLLVALAGCAAPSVSPPEASSAGAASQPGGSPAESTGQQPGYTGDFTVAGTALHYGSTIADLMADGWAFLGKDSGVAGAALASDLTPEDTKEADTVLPFNEKLFFTKDGYYIYVYPLTYKTPADMLVRDLPIEAIDMMQTDPDLQAASPPVTIEGLKTPATLEEIGKVFPLGDDTDETSTMFTVSPQGNIYYAITFTNNYTDTVYHVYSVKYDGYYLSETLE